MIFIKGFALDRDGDLLIENNQISMINGNDLLRQTIERVLGTNKKEWFLNWDEGITFVNILGKEKPDEVIKNEISQGLLQVDSSFIITDCKINLEKATRKLSVSFTARNDNGEILEGVNVWQA